MPIVGCKKEDPTNGQFPCFSRKPPLARKIGSELQLKALKSSIKIVLNIFCVRSAVCVKNTETLTIGGIFFFATDYRYNVYYNISNALLN